MWESSALYMSVCLSACWHFCISLLFPLSGHSSFSSTFPTHSVSFASTSTSTSLIFPSVHPSLPSFFTLSIVVTCGLSEGQWGNSELLYCSSTCGHLFYSPHSSWHRPLWYNKRIKSSSPPLPQGWAFKTTTRADVDTVVLWTAQDLTFSKSLHEVWAKGEKDAMAYLYSIIVIVYFMSKA